MTQKVYAVIHIESTYQPLCIPDGAEADVEYAYGWFTGDDDAIWMEVLKLNTSDFWRGWFYFNDMEGPDEACEVDVNTKDHLDIHWESNNAGGHYDCSRYEHIVNGVVTETIKLDNEDWT